MERGHCRNCGPHRVKKNQETSAGSSQKEKGKGKGKGLERKVTESAEDAEADEGKVARKRPLAPEARSAEATSQADALEASASTLRAAGLTERAAALEEEAGVLRKRAANAIPSQGRRLDECEDFLKRCEVRAKKAEEATLAAQHALETARKLQAERERETAEAKKTLERLRVELTTASRDPDAMETGVDNAAADSAVSADLQALEAELATNLTELADAAAEGRPEAQDAAKLRTLAAQLRRAKVLQEEARKRHRPAARWGDECGDD